MALSIAPFCCVLLLGVVGLANAAPASMEQKGDNLDAVVMAAKFLYDTLSDQKTGTNVVPPRCCINRPPCSDELEFADMVICTTVLPALAEF